MFYALLLICITRRAYLRHVGKMIAPFLAFIGTFYLYFLHLRYFFSSDIIPESPFCNEQPYVSISMFLHSSRDFMEFPIRPFRPLLYMNARCKFCLPRGSGPAWLLTLPCGKTHGHRTDGDQDVLTDWITNWKAPVPRHTVASR